MRVLYARLTCLSITFWENSSPRRNLIPGGRTRPPRVKNYFRKSAKIFANYTAPAQVLSRQTKLSLLARIRKKYLTN
jgi:hypothetical protein